MSRTSRRYTALVPAMALAVAALLLSGCGGSLADADTPPTLEEGYDRLVTTRSFDPGLTPAP